MDSKNLVGGEWHSVGNQRAIRGPSEGHQRAIRGPSEAINGRYLRQCEVLEEPFEGRQRRARLREK
jgi:hypothetical protein